MTRASSLPNARRSLLLTLAVLLAAVLGTAAAGPASAATSPPTGLTLTKATATTMALKWSAAGKIKTYRVKYSTSTKFTNQKYVELTGLSTTVTGLKAKTTYYVKVRGTAGSKGATGYSKVLKVTTPASSPTPTPTPAKPAPKPTSTTAPLRVGSYNVRCANCLDGGKDEGTWAQRRGALVSTILNQHVDVLGVQEASQGRIHDAQTGNKNISQFEDLAARLGGGWKLTNTKRYNCVKDSTPSNCKYAAKGASKGTKILYDSRRITLLEAGSAVIPYPSVDTERSVAWARFRQISTGKSFMFSSLHATSEDKYYSYKKRQAEVAVATIKKHNPSKLPMIAVGDWNSSRFESPTNAPYDTYVKAGFKDPLGGKYRTTKTAPGATVEHRIKTWLNSANHYTRKAPGHPTWFNGSYIDYIMTTPMRVSEWETVANLDKNGNLVGRIPSDHNMVRATVWLPK